MNIYEYTWKGLKSGWDYKLEIIPSGNTDISNPTTVVLPRGCINVRKLGLKYDDYLSGLPETPTLELDIDLELIPADIAFDDFEKSLFAPISLLTTVIDIPDSTLDPVLQFDGGTVFKLSIKYNDNAETAVNIYRTLFMGCYRRDSEFKHDIIEKTLNISVKDINRAVLDSLPWYDDVFADAATDLWREGYLDIAYTDNGTNYGIGQALDGYSFKFSKHTLIEEKLNEIAKNIYRKLIRDSTASFALTLPLPMFYKQTYAGDGALGSALANADLYRLAKIFKGNDEIGGLFYNRDDNSLSNLYSNSAWDYVSELCETSLAKGVFYPDSIICQEIFNAVAGGHPAVTLDVKKLNKLKTSPANVVKTAAASLYESHDDDNYSDIEKYEETQTGTQNEGECTVPVVVNNIPSCVGYSDNGYRFELDGLLNKVTRRAFFPHVANLFYLDKPALIKLTSDPQLFRVHEYCKWQLGDSIFSDTLPGCSFAAFNAAGWPHNLPSECIAAMQASSCLPKWLANTLIAIFGNKEQQVLEFNVDFNEYTYWSAVGDVGFPWYQPDQKFIFDLSNINPYIQTTHTAWEMLSTSLDFENEEATVELLQRMV